MVKLLGNNNFKKLTLKEGISLITLVITIVVIIILAMAVILSLNNNNLISNANSATVKNDISEVQSAYSIYIGDLIIEELDNVQGKGTIGKTSSDFTTTTSAGIKEKRNITLSDVGIDSNNVEEISIVGNQVVGIKWKNKYYDANGNVITQEGYSELITGPVYKGLTITADTEGVTYTDADGNEKALTEPVEDGDIVIYGDYEYRYNMVYHYNWYTVYEGSAGYIFHLGSGWGVRVLDATKIEYSELCGNILGIDVVNMPFAFYECASLKKSPKIPSSIVNMQESFRGCTSLIEVSEISNGVIYMTYTFYGCTALKEAPEIPSSVTSMDDTFWGCTALEEAPEIPSSVTNMYRTFSGCTALKEAPEIPSSVTNMGDTFYGCTALEEAPEIPSSVTDMSRTFEGCTALEEAPEIPSSVTNMSSTFYGCTVLKEAPEIPSSVTSMWYTFYGCTSLTGDIIINANPTSYKYCFKDTTQPIKLIKSGDATDETLANLAGTANNGNVTY